ncbi:hypothetical protein B0H14DRAFT_2690408 [Mycena olivaceomarginata]|nr:hypothetical protein B0H14DRAFT_2690408 [Mycena olivaceomarginata]
MVILAADFLLFCAYILGKFYLGKWCRAENVDEDDEEVYVYSSLRLHLVDKQKSIPHPKRLPPRRSFSPRSPQLYVSQADMLSSRRSFFA